jgi:hypothetical protein
MKTKPITLILTLLFCLSGSAFAEEKKEGKRNYESLSEFNLLKNDYNKSHQEIMDIRKEIDPVDNSTIWELLSLVLDKSFDLLVSLESIQRCLSYERVIIEENITNLRLVVTHDAIKRSAVSDALNYIDYSEKFLKKTKVKIQNVAAVIAINKVLEEMEKIKTFLGKHKVFFVESDKK